MRSQVRFAVLLRRRIPRPEITDGLQLASSWTRDERSLTLRRGRGIRCGQGLWSSLPSRGRETRPTEHCSVDWRGGWGDNASVAPHPTTPAYRRARHPPLKGRDEASASTEHRHTGASRYLARAACAKTKKLNPGLSRGDDGDYSADVSPGMTRGRAMTMLARGRLRTCRVITPWASSPRAKPTASPSMRRTR